MRKSIVALSAALAVALSAGMAQAQDKLKVCFVYVGPHNDGGWSEGHTFACLENDELTLLRWNGERAVAVDLGRTDIHSEGPI